MLMSSPQILTILPTMLHLRSFRELTSGYYQLKELLLGEYTKERRFLLLQASLSSTMAEFQNLQVLLLTHMREISQEDSKIGLI